MVIVVMADQYEIDFWKVANVNSGWSNAFWTSKGDGACPFSPDRIGQNVHPIHLDEDGHVINVSGANAVLHAVWNR